MGGKENAWLKNAKCPQEMPAFLALIKSRRLNFKIRTKTDKELILDRITDPQSRFSTR